MKILVSKWFLIFIYLLIAFPVGIFIAAVTMQILIRVFYFFLDGLSLNLSSIDYVKIFKGSIAGGVIGAIGYWWIYYQHYRKNRSR
ncbi:hypothetical protein B9Q22_23420 [Enterobacter roggenkampii]|uniref:Uncharacterized protein n=1 Tax=Enterobacter roggenkampii TaxID=1812935 RepID=A0A837LFV0_9ENTR|nr:hypothetical protein ABF77_08055 [Enterobacter roggenkampii]RWT58832.1 hypothetical protein DN588_15280 [Enterobacter cloacae]PJD01736.1 hypothetical protein B9Q25_23380 [Enterobacter roggenkampii]PJD14013.1 hypothetical protein B9Q21_23430 [Enterobacter roggenkampii]PJD14698.1 hypothetical protein B9Q22_23420 [Enterobacter roggenkampii]